MSEGVEWAAHSCLTLDWLRDEQPVSTARLAASFGIPPTYLNKQLQALVRAGILESVAGARGGFRLARPLGKISLLDVVVAIEGPDDAFVCTEIRAQGAGAGTPKSRLRKPCAVAAGMRRAETAWRRSLADQSLAEIRANADRTAPDLGDRLRRWYADN